MASKLDPFTTQRLNYWPIQWSVALQIALPLDSTLSRNQPLFAVFLALVLRDAGEQVFNEARFGIFAEFDGGAFEFAASFIQGRAQLQMDFDAARQSADVVD